MEISAVIPVYNEQGNIIPLYSELKSALEKTSDTFEIIFINDGSTDNTLTELETLKDIRIIDLGKNMGQSAAFSAGFKAAKGDIVISLDGDGQNDPKDIPALVSTLKDKQLDVVAGWRKNRHDSKSIVLISSIGRILRFILFGDRIHDSGCSLRAYKREAVSDLVLEGKMHRYIMLILRSKGFKIGEIVVNHRPRVFGVSKYNASKIWGGTMDLLRLRFGEELMKITAISLLTTAIILVLYYSRFL